MSKTIEVTQDDINQSAKLKAECLKSGKFDDIFGKAAEFCPISLAIKRIVPFARVITGVTDIIIREYGKPLRRFEPPPEAKLFIKEFDDGVKVKPFTFKLGLTEQ